MCCGLGSALKLSMTVKVSGSMTSTLPVSKLGE
jgi:hypothetical protein